jgi:hypothetical protein
MQADSFAALLTASNDRSHYAVLHDLLSCPQKRKRGLHELTSSTYIDIEHSSAIEVFTFSSAQLQSIDPLEKMATAPKTQYDSVANGYASYDHLPPRKARSGTRSKSNRRLRRLNSARSRRRRRPIRARCPRSGRRARGCGRHLSRHACSWDRSRSEDRERRQDPMVRGRCDKGVGSRAVDSLWLRRCDV